MVLRERERVIEGEIQREKERVRGNIERYKSSRRKNSCHCDDDQFFL